MINKPMIGVAVAVVIIAGGAWYYARSRPPAVPAVPAEVKAPAEAPAEPALAHPIPAAAGDTASKPPLPPLNDSDAAIADALAHVADAAAVSNYLLTDNIVRRIVATIDNLPRQKAAIEKRPTTPLAGSFLANGDELHATLDARNFARYEPLVAVVRKLDMQQLAAVYLRYYPLFQQAYQDLGYPNGYFNDRLVQVIDVLLATPELRGPIELTRPNVMYTFADPAIEARPAGQKLLIRMGPQNAAAIKTKLTELRTAITAAAPKP